MRCAGGSTSRRSTRRRFATELSSVAPKVLPYDGRGLREARRRAPRGQKRILFEGAQGALLDVDHGTYPYRDLVEHGRGERGLTGAGVGPRAIGYVLGIAKAYTTRVGGGPFPTELFDATGELICERGHEYGVNTGRRRRCGWLDAVLLRQTVRTCGIDGIALTKLDILDGFETIKVCTHYRLDGAIVDRLPASQAAQARVEPIYEEIEGWSGTTAGARSWAALPAQAIKYVRRVEELVGAPVALLSTSPERDDTILVHNPVPGLSPISVSTMSVSTMSTASLFEPLTFAHGPAMKNRFMLAPLTNQQSFADGRLSDDEFRWLTMRATGGFGLVMTCAAHVQAQGQGFPGQLGVFGDQHLRRPHAPRGRDQGRGLGVLAAAASRGQPGGQDRRRNPRLPIR